MMSLPTGCNGRFQAIANPGVSHLNRLEGDSGGRIMPAHPGNAEIGRSCLCARLNIDGLYDSVVPVFIRDASIGVV